MKQAIWSMCVVLLAAGILAGMVIYSVSVMRQYERQFLTGELSPVANTEQGIYTIR